MDYTVTHIDEVDENTQTFGMTASYEGHTYIFKNLSFKFPEDADLTQKTDDSRITIEYLLDVKVNAGEDVDKDKIEENGQKIIEHFASEMVQFIAEMHAKEEDENNDED